MTSYLAAARRRIFSCAVGACAIAFASQVGSRERPATEHLEERSFSSLRGEAFQLYRAGRFELAASLNSRGYREAIRAGQQCSALRFLNNVGSMNMLMFRYREALKVYLRARDLARALHDPGMLASVSVNLSSIYTQMNDFDTALRVAKEARSTAGSDSLSGNRSQLLTQLAWLLGRTGEHDNARAYFAEAIESARQQGSAAAEADAWDYFSEELLDISDYTGADRAVLQAFRIRKLDHLHGLPPLYLNLSRVRMAQGDLPSAHVLASQAIETADQVISDPRWMLYQQRARVLLAEHRPEEAFGDLRSAIVDARRWRAGIVASDSLRTTAGVRLHGLYTDFIDTASLWPAHAVEAFAASEESRVEALRESLTDFPSWRKSLPDEYWQAIAKLRTAEAHSLAVPSDKALLTTAALRHQIMEYEAQAGSPSPGGTTTGEKFSPEKALRDIQASLMPGEALISFHMGDPSSRMWAVSSHTFETHVLPSGKRISSLAERFRSLTQTSGTDMDSAGRSLSSALLGGLSSTIISAKNWLISADDAISDVPFSALPAAVGSGKKYLLEEHAVQMIAGALMLKRGGRFIPDGDFVGVGDAIYNTADPRWASAPQSPLPFLAAGFRTPLGTPVLQMPRLVGSGREINDCASRWGGASPARLLCGARASRRALVAALNPRPAVIHLAAHFLQPAGHPEEAVINLGISDGGDVLNRSEIAALRVPGSLVVMSGCSSGRARSLAGGGAMGLTRAWLLAGANAVIASRWKTPDDSGELFQSFYNTLGKCVRAGAGACRPADALQRAKLAMLHSNSWRSDPKYWAAFYIVGKE